MKKGPPVEIDPFDERVVDVIEVMFREDVTSSEATRLVFVRRQEEVESSVMVRIAQKAHLSVHHMLEAKAIQATQ
jgi:hypothetical protein